MLLEHANYYIFDLMYLAGFVIELRMFLELILNPILSLKNSQIILYILLYAYAFIVSHKVV